MLRLDIIVPIGLLIVIFLLKLFIKRDTSVPQFVNALCEFPSDIVFLGLSFLSATIIKNGKLDILILILLGGIVLEIVVIILWRISVKKAENNNAAFAVVISASNYIISILWLIYSVSTIINEVEHYV
jgi:hypothetical protein